MSNLRKCPACRPSATPGYIVTGNRVTRCEVCKGWGLATLLAIIGWELSM
jgi:hypothetical protein